MIEDLVVVLPCQSIETLSLQRDAAEAEELLSAWSVLYHPVLLAAARKMPRWVCAEAPPEETRTSLIIIPSCSESHLPPDWLSLAEKSGGMILRNLRHRQEMIAAALQGNPNATSVAPALAADFLSLGFCHFQVEVLTRQLRYMSNLDEVRFGEHALAAADFAVLGDDASAKDQLRSAFERLTEAREYFYPVEAYLLDLTLVASTTLGPSLRSELTSARTINLLLSANHLNEMATREPESFGLLQQALGNGAAALIGGEFEEEDWAFLSPEAVLAALKHGLAAYDHHLSRRPDVFGRRRFGLTPVLPQILKKLGFEGSLHFSLDEGQFPSSDQSKIRWEGQDRTEIEALTRIPIDVTHADEFLRLSERLGNTTDLDQASAVVFAHWPGQSSSWYGDLRRMAQYAPVLGRFTSAVAYFQNTQYSGRTVQHSADKYRSPYLRQDVQAGLPNPISRWIEHFRRQALSDTMQTVTFLAEMIGGKPWQSDGELLAKGSAYTTQPVSPSGDDLRRQLEESLSRFASLTPRTNEDNRERYLALNPWSFARNSCLDVPRLRDLPPVAGPITAAAQGGGIKQAVVEIPAMGFAWVGAGAAGSGGESKTKQSLSLAADNALQNEHFKVVVNRTTGAIQALHSYAVRGNRMAQQIAMRLTSPSESQRKGREPGAEEDYSIMAADEVVSSMAGPLLGQIVSRGRLMDREGSRLARFIQTLQVRSGSPILQIKIDLEIERQPGADPWSSYYAARFAWTDESAEFYRGVNLATQRSDANLLEAPHFLDLRSPRTRLTILAGGLPYHRRFGLRKLDTLLCVQGETARSFRLAVGVDLTHPVPAALELLAPDAVLLEKAPPPQTASGWLFHLDAKNVIATHWETLLQQGRMVGFRVRLLETEGRNARAGLRSFRSLASAREVDFVDQHISEILVQDDLLTVEMGPYQWTQIEAFFA